MQRFNLMPLLLALPGLASAADNDTSEPAIIVILLLGLTALIGGLGSVRDMRRKHMLPPRPRQTIPGRGKAPFC